MGARSIVVVSPVWSSFVEADAAILTREYDVQRVSWSGRSSALALRRAMRRADAVLSWFAGDHAVLAGIFARWGGKPVILISGGGDVANMPEIRYGAMAGPIKSRLAAGWSLRAADLVLALSAFSAGEIRKVHAPRRLEVLPLGVDIHRFSPAGPKESLVATVGGISPTNVRRKGLGTFVAAARFLPQTPFVVAGEAQDGTAQSLRSRASENVRFPGRLSDAELVELYRRSKVYVQVSAHEGFGLAVAEAMATECIPVVTRRGSLPEVVGDTGLYVEYDDPAGTARAIRDALARSAAAGLAARARVTERFSLGRRADGLLDILGTVVRGGAHVG